MNDDTISRQAAIEAIRNLYPDMPKIKFMDNVSNWQKKNEKYIECENAIFALPSAQPEIIRCKDCIHCEYALDDTRFCAKLDGIRVWADDFCSRGERRE